MPEPLKINADKLESLFPADSRGPEYGVWYVFVGCTLLCFAREGQVGELWAQLAEQIGNDTDKQVIAARRLREGLLKSSPLVGFPRVSWLQSLYICLALGIIGDYCTVWTASTSRVVIPLSFQGCYVSVIREAVIQMSLEGCHSKACHSMPVIRGPVIPGLAIHRPVIHVCHPETFHLQPIIEGSNPATF